MGEKIFKKSGIVTELAYTVADNLDAAYPELHNNLKQVMQKIPEIILVGKRYWTFTYDFNIIGYNLSGTKDNRL